MKRIHLWMLWAVAGLSIAGSARVRAEEKILLGANVGVTSAFDALDKYVNNGAMLSPYAAYMMNDYVGGVGELHIAGMPNKDSSEYRLEDDATWTLGGSLGPRIAWPLGLGDVYGTFQLGVYTGLSPHSPITDTSWGFSTGGGANLELLDNVWVGGYARYNRLYQMVHGESDVKFMDGGITVTYRFSPPEGGISLGTYEEEAPPPK